MRFIYAFQVFNHMFNKSGTNEKVLEHGKYCLILDLRTEKEFEEKHISNISIGLPTDQLSLEFFNKVDLNQIALNLRTERNKEKLNTFKRFFIVIIFSNEPTEQETFQKIDNNNESLLKLQLLYKWLVSNKCREIGICYEGFNKFEEKYPFLVEYGNTPCEFEKLNDFPSEILENRLYVGNELHVTA